MVNTSDIMSLALKLAGLTEIPQDSGIVVEGENIKEYYLELIWTLLNFYLQGN
ncbi:hypothetical protein PL321_09045 [Caloramator sp. mosi_1]|uniref:hypothetical protein n=1 Tax=Caloramator sp. mosi_1 TaxID=3023090 RepID=UPI002360DF9C|nr:hypothetical protein [Caloramator sp. mosi_1]WDC85448.1 hypothetical protein PL321_09045 [Caloramator sp. mosi_1]